MRVRPTLALAIGFGAAFIAGCGAHPSPVAQPAPAGSAADPTTTAAAAGVENDPGVNDRGVATDNAVAQEPAPPPQDVGVGASTAPGEPSDLVQTMRAGQDEGGGAWENDAARRGGGGARDAFGTLENGDAQDNAADPAADGVGGSSRIINPAGSGGNASAEEDSGETFPVDGMVGQVNGNAIYASEVFEPVGEQLAALGRQLPRSAFEQRSRQIIESQVRQTVIDALILGEAERNLSSTQQRGLRGMLRMHREELLRKHGRGSESLAEKNIRETTGKSLNQTMRDFRSERIVQHYLSERLYPRINVTRRDVERYYQDNIEEFQPRSTRDVRLIRVNTETAAEQVRQQLEGEATFERVASSDINTFKPSEGGMLESLGDNALSQEPLNEAIRQLDQGQRSDAIEIDGQYWFVYIDRAVNPEGQSLMQAQRGIERQLRAQQFRTLSERYRQRLMEEGSYNPVREMVDDLVQIAMSRYAAPASDSDSGFSSAGDFGSGG